MGHPPPLPLSVLIVARNEALSLPRCLASVRGWTAETVVALNQTTDDSAAIAESYGARVHRVPWQGYRDTKNAVLELATQPWVLFLDADEAVSPELRAAITREFTGARPPAANGYRFPRKVWFLNRWITHGDWYPDYNLRLVRREGARWGGDAYVHEKLACPAPIGTLSGDLLHFSFASLAEQIAKITPFADLFVQQQTAKGRRFSTTAAVLRPCWRFFRGYVLRRGFLDGYPGFYIAWANAFGTLVRYSRLYEAEQLSQAAGGREQGPD